MIYRDPGFAILCKYSKKKRRLDVNVKTRVRSKYKIFLFLNYFALHVPCPCSKGASILPPHVPCHCPFTCHICPCPYTSRRASPLPSYTHMCPALAPTRDLPQCLDLALTPTLPLPHMCPALLRFVPRPCPHMCPVFVSTRAPPLHHTCSNLAPLHVP